MIYLRRIYYKESPSISFFINDGRTGLDLDRFQKGDELNLLWDVSPEIGIAINTLGLADPRAHNMSGEWSVHIPFTVVERSHSVCQYKEESGTFRYLGLSITIEAQTGHWEDIWRWVLEGERPEWAE